jgi:hypothetical protein
MTAPTDDAVERMAKIIREALNDASDLHGYCSLPMARVAARVALTAAPDRLLNALADIPHDLDLEELETAVARAERAEAALAAAQADRQATCPTCKGEEWVPFSDSRSTITPCPSCLDDVPCPTCRSTGFCPICGGTGRALKADIAAGRASRALAQGD